MSQFDAAEDYDARLECLKAQVSSALAEHPELRESVGEGWRRGGSRLRMAAIQLGIPISLRR